MLPIYRLVAIFSEYSGPSSDTFSKKRLATNLATFSGVIGDFWRLGRESTYRSYSSQRAAGAAVGPKALTGGPVLAQQSEQEMFSPPLPHSK